MRETTLHSEIYLFLLFFFLSEDRLEVDPAKIIVTSPEMLTTAQTALRSAAERVLDTILDAKNECPSNLRELCCLQREEAAKKFPGSQLTIVGGFLFLRYFVPAITAPDGFGVISPPLTPATRRAMVLVAKLIQNLANLVEFGAKEPYLTPLNHFIVDNKAKMMEYLDAISTRPRPHALARSVPPVAKPKLTEAEIEAVNLFFPD